MIDEGSVTYSHSGTFTASIHVPNGSVWTGTGETKCRAAEDLAWALAERLGKLCSPHRAAAEAAAEEAESQRIQELEAQLTNIRRENERVKGGLVNDLNAQRRKIAELQVELAQAVSTLSRIGALVEAKAGG